MSFAWGRVGHRSSIWNVTATAKGDVYISEQTMAKETKLSLHLSGDWRNAWVRDQRSGRLSASGARYAEAEGSRLLDRWSRPSPTGPITHGVSVAVTPDDVQPWFDDLTVPGDVEWSDMPQEGCVGVVSVLLVKPHKGAIEMPVTGIVAIFGMESGEAVWVVAKQAELDDNEMRTMRAMRAKMSATVTVEEREALPPYEQPRAIFYSTPTAGPREIWDAALPDTASGGA